MKYYLLKNEEGNAIPTLLHYNRRREAERGRMEKKIRLEESLVMTMRLGRDFVYPDVMASPLFLLSQKAARLLSFYEEKLAFLPIVLFGEGDSLEWAVYQRPLLEKRDVLSEQSVWTKDKKDVRTIVLNREKVREKSIFQIGRVFSTYIILRMDLAESLLDRGAIGIGLQEVQVDG